jgi:hypothetical protein
MVDFIKAKRAAFVEAGPTDIIFWIYWEGIQGNMEFTPKEPQKSRSWEYHCASTISKPKEMNAIAHNLPLVRFVEAHGIVANRGSLEMVRDSCRLKSNWEISEGQYNGRTR